jgi:hypothetical protein
VQRSRVHEVELGAVAQHERDRIATAHAEACEPARETFHAQGVLAPGDRNLAGERAEGDALRYARGGALERRAE